VPQDIYLRDDSLKRNICLGLEDEEIDEEKLLESVRLAKLDNFILNLPKKIDTVVGERGTQISGGQLQRVGIARALYNSPEVLIFDEATSSLDSETENIILNEINKMKNTKTIIIITHRVSSLAICDEVYEISSGSLKRNENKNDFFFKGKNT
jgi:ATP-binding cassette subfamily C protein